MKVIFKTSTDTNTKDYLTTAIPKYLTLNNKTQSMAKMLTDDMPNELHQQYYELSYELRNLKRDIEVILRDNDLTFSVITSPTDQKVWIEIKGV